MVEETCPKEERLGHVTSFWIKSAKNKHPMRESTMKPLRIFTLHIPALQAVVLNMPLLEGLIKQIRNSNLEMNIAKRS